jgi:hypothetical protein
MTEAEIVEQAVQYMGLLLIGVSLIFSVVSAYIVALNYFVGDAMFMARLGAFAFVSLILALLMVVMIGAQNTHTGLVEALRELESNGGLSPAGRAVLDNTRAGTDGIVRLLLWVGMVTVFGALGYMTFLHRWTPDVVNVQLQSTKRA